MKKFNLNELGKSLSRGEMRHVNGGNYRNACEASCNSELDCTGQYCTSCSGTISRPEKRCRFVGIINQ